ncbi:uncharacterized protein LOC142612100 [Castanea sativa]|uniref:uncharacterized protein LOC142612100 n=1 Tax=Castanea sativa TaxID=21020 RepID=UPI003F649318
MANVAIEYFQSIFHSWTCQRMEECLGAMQHNVTPAMQDILSSDYSAEEIKAALFQMGPTKAPGPDGMNALFYKKYWHIVGDDVIAAILDFLNLGNMISEINYTHIVLIPKVKLITDNVLVAYETLHGMHYRKSGKKRSLALKLDASKAYDRVEWEFLKGIMIRLGFPKTWIEGVMCCVSTPSFSVCINVKAYGSIIPSRGLR